MTYSNSTKEKEENNMLRNTLVVVCVIISLALGFLLGGGGGSLGVKAENSEPPAETARYRFDRVVDRGTIAWFRYDSVLGTMDIIAFPDGDFTKKLTSRRIYAGN